MTTNKPTKLSIIIRSGLTFQTIRSIIVLSCLFTLNACLRQKDYQDDLKVAAVSRDDLTIDLFYLRGEANAEGVVVWERCIDVSETQECTPLPNSTKREMPLVNFRKKLGETMIKDITVLEFARSYGQVLGAVIAQGDPIKCPKSPDIVVCEHQSFETYHKEYKWLKAAFGFETQDDNPKRGSTSQGKPEQITQNPVQETNRRDLGMSLEPGKSHTLTINSQAMNNAEWSFNIYLPATYRTQSKRYSVLYSLHGGGGDHNSNIFEVNYIIQTNPDTIIVFPNGGRDNFYLDQNVIRQQSQNPDRHIIKELIPYIDDNFRTIKSRENRTISGFSMGGYGAFHFAFKYPEYFGAMAAMGAGGPYGPGGLIRDYSPQEDPRKLIPANAEKIRGKMPIVIAVGRQDLYDYNREFSEILDKAGLAHQFIPLDGVGHDHGRILNSLATRIYSTILPKSAGSTKETKASNTELADNGFQRKEFCKKYNWDGLTCQEVDIFNSTQSSCKWGQRWWCAEGCAKWGWFC